MKMPSLIPGSATWQQANQQPMHPSQGGGLRWQHHNNFNKTNQNTSQPLPVPVFRVNVANNTIDYVSKPLSQQSSSLVATAANESPSNFQDLSSSQQQAAVPVAFGTPAHAQQTPWTFGDESFLWNFFSRKLGESRFSPKNFLTFFVEECLY